MTLSPYLPAYWPGRNVAYAINANPAFGAYATSPGVPDFWIDAGNAGGATRQLTGQVSQYAMRLAGGAGANAGITYNISSAIWPGARWYVMECVVKLISGALTGAGSWVDCFTDDAHGTATETIGTINLATTADVDGTVHGAGTVGASYHWRVLVQAKKANSLSAIIYAWSHHSTLGSTAGANSIDWSQCSVRPASIAEIAAGNQVNGLPVFPILPGQSPESSKIPNWNTLVKRSASGRERRTPLWSYPLWEFDLSYDVIRQRPTNDELAGLFEFFNVVEGQWSEFLYLDQDDYIETGAPIGTGDGATTQFQMQRSIRSWAEPVRAAFGVSVFDNGAASGLSFSIGADGIITFTTPPTNGHVMTWSGGFFYVCRFLDDRLDAKRMFYQLWSGGLKVTTVKD